MLYVHLFVSLLLFFLYFQTATLYGGDAGDLVAAAYTGGIAHPPGYPLYSFLGYMFTKIPLSTVAGRMSLLSSIPMAGAITIIAILTRQITRNLIISITTAFMLGSTYLLWLYAIVPEVFALNALFTASILYLSYSFITHPTAKKLYLLALVAGLSVTHHHIIVFTFPVAAYALWTQKKFVLQETTLKEKGCIILLGFLGLLPYSWAYIAAIKEAPIVWSNPHDLNGLFRLFTRAEYGSFQSGIEYGQDIKSRLLQFPLIYEFYTTDFTPLAVPLSIAGAIGLWRKSKDLFAMFVGGFFVTGPLFFFYASYLIESEFQIATAERFLTPSYLFLSIIMAYGVTFIIQFTRTILTQRQIGTSIQSLVHTFITALFIMIPLSLFYINYPKVSVLKNDLTAEKFAYDVMSTPEKNSIFFLIGDHAVFNTQYMYYAYGLRNDISIIHFAKFLSGTHDRQIEKYYPDLTLPDVEDPLTYVDTFIDMHYDTYPIYATFPFAVADRYVWIPFGLTYKLYALEDLPPHAEIVQMNNHLWDRYQDPLSGSLGLYKNLMLYNIVDYYRNAAARYALHAEQYASDYDTAIAYYEKALYYQPDYEYVRYLLAHAYTQKGDCEKAQNLIESTYATQEIPDERRYAQSNYILYSECFNDEETASYWQEKIEQIEEDTIRPLEEL